MELILFIAGSIGLAHIFVDGGIFAWLRNWLREPTLGLEKLDSLTETRFWWIVASVRWLVAISNAWFWWIVVPVQWFIAKVSEMIHCHQCCGFWTGLFCSWLVFSEITGWEILVGGFAGSFFSTLFAILFNYLEAQTIIKFPPNDPLPPT